MIARRRDSLSFLPVPTLLEIAEHADVPVESVLRVLNGESVSDAVSGRVSAAMETLGSPDEGVVKSVNVLEPSVPRAGELLPSPSAPVEVGAIDTALAGASERLLASFGRAAAELEANLPQGVSDAVHQSLRVTIKPVARRMEELSALLEELGRTIEEVKGEVAAERRERLDDVRVLLDAVETGWRTVDQRLGRVERLLELR
jgi:Bacterial regulatory proteins, lacI family